jgi:cell division protein FtsB
MTEKRFGVITNWCIYENVNGVEKWLTFDKVVELLNELHEENQALKSDRARYEEECRLDIFKELHDENEKLKLENSGLKYALKYIKKIDVKIEVDDFND